MLSPEYLDSLPARLVQLIAQAETDILADMARRLTTYDYYIPAAQWQHKKLQELGLLHQEITKRLSKLTGLSEKELDQMLVDAGDEALKNDDAIYRKAGLNPPPVTMSETLRKVLNSGARQTRGTFRNIMATTAKTATGQFESALDRAWMQISTGAFDRNTAIRFAIKDLSRQGVGAIRYPTGHVATLEVATRRAIVTGANQTAGKLQFARAEEMDCDLVEVSAHGGARPEHAAWQGKVFSLSGKSDQYPPFSETGYGTGVGLCGWNCRHSFSPYFDGTPRAYTPEMLADLERKKFTYNGHAMTEAEARAQQRYIERQIRRWKREQAAMQAADLPADQASAKLAQWQRTQRDFLRQTGLKRQYDRELVVDYAPLPAKSKTKTAVRDIIKTTKEPAPGAIEAIRNQEWARQIREPDRDALFKHFENATDKELAFWSKYGSGIKGDFYDHSPRAGYYRTSDKTVHLGIDVVDDRVKRTGDTVNARLFFHETGHFFDFNIGNRLISETSGLHDALFSDAIQHANTVLKSKNLRPIKSFARLSDEQKRAISLDLLDDKHLKNAVSDIYSGLTNCRACGWYGHSTDYWKAMGPAGVDKEAVAHMFEAKMMKGERLEVFRQYFPSAYEVFEKTIEGIES